MCIRSGRDCPGIPDGPLIIDMTKTAKHGMQKRSAKVSTTAALVQSSADRPTSEWNSIPRMSQSAVFTEAFYERFLSYFTCDGETKDIRNKASWLHRLPALATDGTNEALQLAIQATSSVYCSVETTTYNPALARYAWDLYGEALRKHSGFLTRPQTRDAITAHMVSTSVLFSLFEAIHATSPNAYRSHVFGAAKMLEYTGKEQCQKGMLCQIFYHIRTQISFIYLIGMAQHTEIEVNKILRATLEYSERTIPVLQRIISIVMALTEVYIEQNDQETVPAFDLVTYMQTQTDLITLWREYESKAIENGEQLSWMDPATGETQFRDRFTSLIVAWFAAARILLAVVAPHITASFMEMIDPYGTVMACAQYLEVHDIGCAYMRMGTPLILVALHSPDPKQRTQAITCFGGWGDGSMRGIGALAIGYIDQRRKKWEVNEAIPIKPTSAMPLRIPEVVVPDPNFYAPEIIPV